MKDEKDKIECLYSKCKERFIPKNKKTKFCKASHRVMWHREEEKRLQLEKEKQSRQNKLTSAARGRDESGINEDEIKDRSKVPQYQEILSLAKGGAKRDKLEELIKQNGKLTPPQVQMIYSKITQI